MKTKYYLITYKWMTSGDRHWEFEHDVHKGSIAAWVLMSIEQPEKWILVNAVEITEEEYNALDGEVG